MQEDIGEAFQKGTKYRRDDMDHKHLDWCKKPDAYKRYDDTERIGLPRELPELSKPVLKCISERRSIRRFSSTPLSIRELSILLWASTGIQRVEQGYAFRTAPSAGALYPIETYVISNCVSDLENGVYHYSISDHALELLRRGDLGQMVSNAALGQEMCTGAPVVFIWSSIFERSKWKYRERAYRYIYLDAGHIAENLALSATGLGLGTCQIGAFYDDELNALIGIDGVDESVIYASVAGHPY